MLMQNYFLASGWFKGNRAIPNNGIKHLPQVIHTIIALVQLNGTFSMHIRISVRLKLTHTVLLQNQAKTLRSYG